MVTGFSKAVLSILKGNMGYNVFTVEADKEFQRKLEIACHIFWYMVETEVEPADYVDFNLMEKIANGEDSKIHFGEEVPTESWIQRTKH
jgi:hypothetical protein